MNAKTCEAVLLRGVNRSGLEYSSPDGNGSLANAGITTTEIEEMVLGWGCNVIRLPFNQDWTLSRSGYDAGPYLAALDYFIEHAAALGAYTLLDLQWLDAVEQRGTNNDGTKNFVPPLPNDQTYKAWRRLAARYAGESAVLYDVFNEPHDVLRDDRGTLLGVRGDGTTFPLSPPRVSMVEWQPWASFLVNVIRSQNPTSLVFVSGVNWAYDLRGFPLAGVEGVVYSTHVYRNKGDDWQGAFGDLAEDYPVFVGEWGGSENDIAWGTALAQYLSERGIGWTAWSWSDNPLLVSAPGVVPTAFGALVRDCLRRDG